MTEIEELKTQIKTLEGMLNLKQTDWLETCKEVEQLEAALREAGEGFRHIRECKYEADKILCIQERHSFKIAQILKASAAQNPHCLGGFIPRPSNCKNQRNHPFTCGCSVPIARSDRKGIADSNFESAVKNLKQAADESGAGQAKMHLRTSGLVGGWDIVIAVQEPGFQEDDHEK